MICVELKRPPAASRRAGAGATRRLPLAAPLVAVLLAPATAGAAPIVYTFSGTGSGSFAGAEFTDAPVTLRVTADTARVAPITNLPDFVIFDVPDDSTRFEVLGAGSATLTKHKRVFVNQTTMALGFGEPGNEGDILFFGAPEFASYGLTGPLGPVFAEGNTIVSTRLTQEATTAGLIDLQTFHHVTFTATPVPEPAGAALLAAACAPLLRRRIRGRGGSPVAAV
jgi:hypothetical protein